MNTIRRIALLAGLGLAVSAPAGAQDATQKVVETVVPPENVPKGVN